MEKRHTILPNELVSAKLFCYYSPDLAIATRVLRILGNELFIVPRTEETTERVSGSSGRRRITRLRLEFTAQSRLAEAAAKRLKREGSVFNQVVLEVEEIPLYASDSYRYSFSPGALSSVDESDFSLALDLYEQERRGAAAYGGSFTAREAMLLQQTRIEPRIAGDSPFSRGFWALAAEDFGTTFVNTEGRGTLQEGSTDSTDEPNQSLG